MEAEGVLYHQTFPAHRQERFFILKGYSPHADLIRRIVKRGCQAVFSESFEQFGLFSREFLIAENALGAQVGKAFDQGEEVTLVFARRYRVAVGPHP